MTIAPELRERLQRARLGSQEVERVLEDLEVEVFEDLAYVTEGDLQDLGPVTRRKCLELVRSAAVAATAEPAPEPPAAALAPASPQVPAAPAPAPRELACGTGLVAHRPPVMQVPNLMVRADGVRCERWEGHRWRPAHWGRGDPEGWRWAWAEFEEGSLAALATAPEQGVWWEGREFFIMSSSKGRAPKLGTAWLASPPSGGASAVEQSLQWGERLQLLSPTDKRPHPDYLLRARVKQLFSSVVAVVDTSTFDFHVNDDRVDEWGAKRDDGAGEVSPEILQALWRASRLGHDDLDEEGFFRHVPGSAQCRRGGVKGMLGAAERLRGLRRLEVPRSMLKFEGFGERLGVIVFSTVSRPAIPRHLALLLEGRGVASETLLDYSERQVKDILGPLTMRQAARVLGGESGDAEEQSSWYLATMAKLLGAGFSVAQHPLLESVRRQQEAGLKRALRSVRAPGVWSCHGVPEPLPPPGEEHILRGRQVFCMVPAPELNELGSPGWRALAGPVLLYEGTDRDPSAIRLCEAVDAEPLREKCHPGVLYFSAVGEAIQDGLSWDFDGDRFYVIENRQIVQEVIAHDQTQTPPAPPLATPSRARAPRQPDNMPRLQEVQANFLQTFPEYDVAGQWHTRWEILVGKGPGAVNAPEALDAARQYKFSLDVEKGGPRPPKPPWSDDAKWDFMKNPGPEPLDSPTVAGAVFRAVTRRQEELSRRSSVTSQGADSDLHDAWLRASLDQGTRRHLIELAGKTRGKWLERIKNDIRRNESDDADSNFNPHRQKEAEALFDSFREQLLAECKQEAERVGASLEDLALAAWWQKYVAQGVGTRVSDPDKTWPWALFEDAYIGAKERVVPCSLNAAERCRRHLRSLFGAARSLLAEASEQSRSEYLRCLQRAREKPRCTRCAAQFHGRLEALGLAGSGDPGVERVVEALGVAARSRQASRIGASALFYCKGKISRTFRNGKQAGVALENLASRLASGDESPLKDLKLTAVVYHDKHFVVEGNCRLWCLKEAARRTGRDLEVQVEVVDLHLGYVRQQDAGQPALRAFFQRLTTRTDGESVDWDGDDERAGPDGASQAPEGGAPWAAPGGPPDTASAASPRGAPWAPEERGGGEFDGAFRGLGSRQLVEARFSEMCGLHHPANGGSLEDFQRLVHAYDEALARVLAPPASGRPPPPAAGGRLEQAGNQQPPTPAASALRCPKCDASMKERTNKETKQRFWGCSTYPRCRGTRPGLASSQQPPPRPL